MKLYHAQLFPMDQPPVENGWVEVQNGKITALASGEITPQPEDLDLQGAKLLPGFIDAHTHLGIIADGLGFEGDDCNEASDPFTPHLRTIDGVNPLDGCFREARQRGITSVLTSPGSANAAGGEVLAIKTAGRRIDDMVIRTAGMKFALGENPKTVYNDRDETPVTRMAIAGLIREGLSTARRYQKDLQAYEADPDNLDMPEFDIKSEALLPLLRRECKAFFHCHRADDLFTAVRIAEEFHLDPVLIHATEGHLVADILGKLPVSAVVGPLLCDRCKPELRAARLQNAAKLHENGVPVAICTDHPETPIQYLPLSALAAIKGGLPYMDALHAITLGAAEIAGIADRVGSITPGKDADLQCYQGDPLDFLNEPDWVMLDGEILKKETEPCVQ